MRVLYLVHDFLPRHPLGTEIYTWKLARAVQARGHDVRVATTEKDVSRQDRSVRERVWDGLPVTELTNNLFYEAFRETWDWEPAQRAFAALLDEHRPDVVHAMHLLYTSVGCLEEAAQRGIPVLFTLHDFWLQCARMGQRLHPDGSVCDVIDHDRCGGCLTSFKWTQTDLERRTARMLAGIRSTTGLDLSGPVRAAAALARGGEGAPAPGPPDVAHARELAAEVATREEAMRTRVVPHVARFLAPSRFLLERFVEWGVPRERIEHSPYGIDVSPFEGFRRSARGERVRVAFVGSLRRHKGPHVLLDAWSRLDPELRRRGRLRIHGPEHHDLAYLRELRTLARGCHAELAGEIRRDRLADELAEVDVLVVPSTWYENSPLVIHEALATRTPLVVSDLGGMAELVDEGVSGWPFRVDDPRDLARVLAEVLRDPARLDSLYPDGAPVRTIEDDAEAMEARYAAAAGAPA